MTGVQTCALPISPCSVPAKTLKIRADCPRNSPAITPDKSLPHNTVATGQNLAALHGTNAPAAAETSCGQPVLWSRLLEMCCRKSVPEIRSGNPPSRIAVPTGPGTRAVDQTAPGDCSRSCTFRPSLHQHRGRYGSFLSPAVAVNTSDQTPHGCSSELSERLQSQLFRWLVADGG